eukprot:10069049-Alexandrium_andersonii.AAC.1
MSLAKRMCKAVSQWARIEAEVSPPHPFATNLCVELCNGAAVRLSGCAVVRLCGCATVKLCC